MHYKLFAFLLFISFLTIPDHDAFGQITGSARGDTILIDDFIKRLEQKHNISVYYQQQWFDGIYPDAAILQYTLDNALNALKQIAGLNILQFDDLVVFIPLENERQRQTTDDPNLILVGDQNIFGRYSSARFSGYINDGATGEPLIGAAIYNEKTGQGVSTNLEGFFSVIWPTGDFSIRISYMGYEDSYKNIRLFSEGNHDFDLFASTTFLNAVIVEARRAQHNVLRTQMSTVTLNSQAIKELPGTFGERDIVRSITLLPGVQTVGEFGTGFNVRGGSSDQNLILVENVPVFNSSHLFGLISIVNPDLVENVTLMKAGIPAKYGERASSILDIKLNGKANLDETRVAGSLGLLNSRMLVSTPVVKEKATVSFGARGSHTDWFLRRMPNDDLVNSSSGFRDFTGMANITLSPANFLSVFGYHSFDRFGIEQENSYNYTNDLFSLRWNSIINPFFSSTLVLGLSNYRLQIDEIPYLNPNIHSSMNSGVDYRKINWVLHSTLWQNHNIDFGINLARYDIDPGFQKPLGEDSMKPEIDLHTERAVEAAIFLSDEFEINDRLNVELGLRFNLYYQLGPGLEYQFVNEDARSYSGIIDSVFFNKNEIIASYPALEPRIGLRYILDPESSIKFSYNRINQFVNLVSNSAVIAPADVWKVSDRYIKPLQSDQFALGYFRNFLENSIETSLEVYYKKLNNVVEYKSGADIMMNRYLVSDIVNAKGFNYGAELYIKKVSGRLTGWSSYTYSVSQRRTQAMDEDAAINRNEYFPSDFDRPHNFIMNSTYHISRRWRFGMTFTYNTGRPVTLPELVYNFQGDQLVFYGDRNKYRLPDYHRLDISITMDENLKLQERGKGSWTFSVMNLYGRKNPYTVFYKKEKPRFEQPGTFNLYQLYIIGRPFPTLTYTFSF
ncbi:MAG: TonB-dependent receptor [Bacteroidales bacterium]|nr:TonB-dependent receptor [Bacteroidales bacterium]